MSRRSRLRLVAGGPAPVEGPPPHTLEELLAPYALEGTFEVEEVTSLIERAREWDAENRRRRTSVAPVREPS